MYVLYYTTRVLVTPTGPRPLPSLLIPATSSLLVATPVGYLLKLSRVSTRTFHTFISLARNAGRRSPLSTVLVTGGSKLDPQGVECRFLGYAGGSRNYKVQDLAVTRVFVSRDVIFEEGEPHHTSQS